MMNLDGYGELVNILKDSTDFKNVYKILFYPVKVDGYMEQHTIYEIVEELLIRIGIDRPRRNELVDYIIHKLAEISKKVNSKKTLVINFQNCTADSLKMLKSISKNLQIPLVFEAPSFNNQHEIICDFQNSTNKLMRISEANNNNSSKSLECNLKLKKAIDLKLCHNNLQHVIQNLRLTAPFKRALGKWNCRVLVVGRLGSGRKTQAKLLAKEFGLVFINFEQQLSQLSCLGSLQEILLKPECLHNGYVIVLDVISTTELALMMEKFIHPLNLTVFIHTNEGKCRRRVLKSLPQFSDLDHRMGQYNLHKKAFLKYFTSRRDKIYHVNGNGAVDDVKSCIWARLCCK